jgi:RNA polymerase sigma-70 factor (ECF subfamily)
MYQIARNAIIDHYRSRNPGQTLAEDISADPREHTEHSDQTRQEMASWLLPLIAILPLTYREPVRLSEIEGRSHQEVAGSLDISLSAAKSRVRRGKLLIKEALTECCRFEFDQRGRVIDYEPREDGNSIFDCEKAMNRE